MRVYEFSKKNGIPNKELLQILRDNGFDLPSHMSLLPDDAQVFLEKQLHKKTSSSPITAEIKKETMQTIQIPQVPVPPVPEKEVIRPTVKPVIPKVVPEVTLPLMPMSLTQAAHIMGKPVSELILTLLKQRIVTTKNQILSEKILEQLARQYSIKTVPVEATKDASVHAAPLVSEGVQEERLPVVVVIGHVDHGKTTLLDFIRKTRIAAKEKGGITQHLGAYEAKTDHGNVVFLDTPGHEAFSMMRVRGIKVADIAILVVAADDGIMPQTIEAIKLAKEVGLPVIVAINKVDKATPSQIEAVKRGLTQHDLAPEEWGGQTVCVPISAKLGQGINELLEVVILQSQLMELKANMRVPARGFVLESKLEKGRGPVATIICQHGILHVGDYFVCGSTQGKVSSLVDFAGKRVQEARPSIPVQVAGFASLPQTGDLFEVVLQEEMKRGRTAMAETRSTASARQVQHENALNIIIKTDGASSKEALLNSITKLSGKAFKEFYVISAGVGAITESDVVLASDTKSIIYGLHAKVEPNAATLAQKLGVLIKLYDIIYKMLEDLHTVAEQGRPVKKVLRKIGEATVLKVFDIKNLGVIAGAQVKSGRFSKDGKVIVFRGKFKVGEGMIKSLQRDRKSVKEVHTGFECAFMIEGFTEWQPEDRVECYLEMAELE